MQEVLSKRSMYAKHFRNPDGTITAHISLAPVHYRDEQGQWQDIDLTIVPQRNWEFEYAVKKNNFRAYFNDSTDIENATLASFEIKNRNGDWRWINYKLFGASPTGHSYVDNRFKFENVFPNIDLEYIVTPIRLKENIIIKEPVNEFSFTFTLKMSEGLQLNLRDDGRIDFIDTDTGETLWYIAKPCAEDAEGRQTFGVEYSLGKQNYNGIEYDAVTVTVTDTDFLASAVYPVVVDPTTTKYVTYDAYVDSIQSDSNYGDSSALYVRNEPDGPEYISYLKCPPTSDINGYITKIELAIWYSYIWNHGTIYVKEVTSYWSESTVTYNTRPSIGSTITSFHSDDADITGRYIIDVTGANLQYGLALTVPKGSTFVRFDSAEHSSGKNPRFMITYNESPTTPTLTAPNGGETWDTVHTITWNASTDPEGDSITYEIDLSTDNGNTWKNIATGVSGTSYEYDFSNETASSICLIRIRAYDGYSYSDNDQSDGVFTIQHKAQIGTLKLTKGGGTVLDIPLYDPDVGMDGKNQLRIALEGGVIACFELVDVTDPLASPLRVMTPAGVKAVAKSG